MRKANASDRIKIEVLKIKQARREIASAISRLEKRGHSRAAFDAAADVMDWMMKMRADMIETGRVRLATGGERG